MRIGIIGAGNVGRALGRAWLAGGHDARWGVPQPGDPKYADLGGERLGSPAAAAQAAEAIVLATPWPATESAVRSLGTVAGKILIDCTNPLVQSTTGQGAEGLTLALGHTVSGGELVARWAAGAAVFKTLNQTGAENMARAREFKERPVMFVAGDERQKPIVLGLVAELGFDAVDAGPLDRARLLEPFGMLWIDQALMRGAGRGFAFARLTRS
ncbi:MAG TPA: NAD(P)-binding domain-containing protein [Stellaceae bacterium]|nr:NAD(P)-binding domain-containing protein [Stellaceae bacterium]